MAPQNILQGINNNQIVIEDQIAPINSVTDSDGTNRLCVSMGIPKQGQVTSFKSISSGINSFGNGVIDGTTLYTVPQGKTFYIFGVDIASLSTTAQTYDYFIGSEELAGIMQSPNHITFIGFFPVAVVQQGQTIYMRLNGAPAPINTKPGAVLTVWGYEEFGVTN
jgi:hypothetical protein